MCSLLTCSEILNINKQAALSLKGRAMLSIIEYLCYVTQGQLRSFEMTVLSRTCGPTFIVTMPYLVLFLGYSASDNGTTLKSGHF